VGLEAQTPCGFELPSLLGLSASGGAAVWAPPGGASTSRPGAAFYPWVCERALARATKQEHDLGRKTVSGNSGPEQTNQEAPGAKPHCSTTLLISPDRDRDPSFTQIADRPGLLHRR